MKMRDEALKFLRYSEKAMAELSTSEVAQISALQAIAYAMVYVGDQMEAENRPLDEDNK
jgi:hypothetical protein